MSDIFNKEKRSKIMGLVKGKNTKPEMALRKNLHSRGFRFRIHDRTLPGRPDIILRKYKTVIFVNGCFWHGHVGCKSYSVPKSNNEYWVNKIRENLERDTNTYRKLRELGWNVLIVWTCELKKSQIDVTANNLVKKILEFNAKSIK